VTSGLGVIGAVRRAFVDAGEPDPLDEAALLDLEQRGLDGASLATDDTGFALVRAGDLVLAVAPEARGAGTGGRLLAEVNDADRAWSHGDHPAAAALARRHGWERTRELWVMRRSASQPLDPLEVPEGLTIRSYRDDDAAALLDVNARAFAFHREQGGMDAADLARRMAEPWYDPAGLLVAEREGRLVGFHWTKQHSADVGEVYVVAVDPDAHRRGLGRLLTLAGLHHLHGLGVGEVILYVESDNVPALHVYRDRLGFTHAPEDTHVQYTLRR
jgi:mycothiol synthase